MKTVLTLFLCLFCAAVAYAQQAPAANSSAVPPGLTVSNVKWSREIKQSPRGRTRHIEPSTDVFRDRPFGTLDNGPSWYPQPLFKDNINPFPPSGRFSRVYVYSAQIRNDGAKPIKAVAWEYVVSDPATGEELSRREFFSYKKIDNNSSETLRGSTFAPPSNVVSVKGLEKDKHSPYNERVEFKCVLYRDGTVWQNPSATESDCLRLKNRETTRRRPGT